MNGKDIIHAAFGTRHLVLCAKEDQETMLDELCAAAETGLRERTRLNACAIASMDMSSPGEGANEFSDLSRLCGKLVISAGRRSHFAGLLLLNVSSLLERPEDALRLKALGEMLALRGGLASQCVTVLYGPEDEDALFSCADLLDFDGQLRVGAYESHRQHAGIAEILRRASARCDTPETQTRLEAMLSDMAKEANFNPDKLVHNCSHDGVITGATLSAQLDDPYSYVNRFKRAAKPHAAVTRRIGFHTSR